MELTDLNKSQLIDLLEQYDHYIQNANDENLFHEGWRPVCMAEFLDSEAEIEC